MLPKYMLVFSIAAIVCGLIFVGWKLTARSAYESAEYVVLENEGNIEVREYPDLMMATTEMGSRTQGGDGSFGRLFRYISGGNENDQKVAMTTPVFTEQGTAQSNGQMGFVIPKKVASSSIPQPVGENVKLSERRGGKFAVIRFAGRAGEDSQIQKLEALRTWIKSKGYSVVGEPEFASYDPPWTPGMMRRNEILLRLAE